MGYLNEKLYLQAPGHLDWKLKAFSSKAVALAAMPYWQREIGQVVNVLEGGTTVRYWFKDGVLDANLVLLDTITSDGTTITGTGTDADPVTGILPFASLTIASAATTWDCLTGLNKTVSASTDFTLTISNVANGMIGMLNITLTGTTTITLSTGLTNKGAGDLEDLTAGNYVFCFEYDGSIFHYNINLYE